MINLITSILRLIKPGLAGRLHVDRVLGSLERGLADLERGIVHLGVQVQENEDAVSAKRKELAEYEAKKAADTAALQAKAKQAMKVQSAIKGLLS